MLHGVCRWGEAMATRYEPAAVFRLRLSMAGTSNALSPPAQRGQHVAPSLGGHGRACTGRMGFTADNTCPPRSVYHFESARPDLQDPTHDVQPSGMDFLHRVRTQTAGQPANCKAWHVRLSNHRPATTLSEPIDFQERARCALSRKSQPREREAATVMLGTTDQNAWQARTRTSVQGGWFARWRKLLRLISFHLFSHCRMRD